MATSNNKAGSQNIVILRKSLEEALLDVKDTIDARDVDRIMKEDEYASLYLNWSNSIEDAVKLIIKCFKWRCLKNINDLTVEVIGEDYFKKGHVFLLGQTIKGSRVLHFRAGHLEKKDREKSMKLLLFWLERIQRREPGELITFILDTTDSGLRNSDMGFVTFIIECFTTYFPCMLERMIVFNLPTILNSLWKLISKMLSAEQREATVLCGKAEMLQYIDAEYLPEYMGGKSKFEFTFPPFPDDLEAEF